MTTDKDRAEFEEVVREAHGHLSLLVRDDGKYVNLYTQSMFDLWCLARSRSGAVPAVTDAMVEVALRAANKYALQDERQFNSAEDCMRAALVAAFGAAAPEPQQAEIPMVPAALLGEQLDNVRSCEAALNRRTEERNKFAAELSAIKAASVSPHHGDAPADERARFEHWATGETMDVSHGPKTYKFPSTRFAWAAWQARAAPVSAPADAREGAHELLMQAIAAMSKLRQSLEFPGRHGGLYVFPEEAVRTFTDEQARLMYEERNLKPGRDSERLEFIMRRFPGVAARDAGIVWVADTLDCYRAAIDSAMGATGGVS